MAYNNYYPATYQPGYQMNYQQPTYVAPQPTYSGMQPQNQNGIVWVQGEAAAKAYPVAPGSNALLMDSEGECFYIKSTDASGMPLPLRTFEYKEVMNASQTNVPQISQDFDPNMYVKRSEYEDLKKTLEELKSSMGSAAESAASSAKQRIEGRSNRNG